MKLADFLKGGWDASTTTDVAPTAGDTLPSSDAVQQHAPQMGAVEGAAAVGPAYVIQGTKGCTFPITVEKRRGKLVTYISNCSGDTQLLCQQLSKLLGCGASFDVAKNKVFVQGRHDTRIEEYLVTKQSHCLKGIMRKKKQRIETAVANVAAQKKQREAKKKSRDVINKHEEQLKKNKTKMQASVDERLTRQQIAKMKPKEMKIHLGTRGLSIQGSKGELMARLVDACFPSPPMEDAKVAVEATPESTHE